MTSNYRQKFAYRSSMSSRKKKGEAEERFMKVMCGLGVENRNQLIQLIPSEKKSDRRQVIAMSNGL